MNQAFDPPPYLHTATDQKLVLCFVHCIYIALEQINILTFIISSFPGAGTDVWFSIRNRTYQNNSIVTLENIGEGNDALLCMTNQTACCRRPYTNGTGQKAIGNWFFPNETRVPSSGAQWDIHRTRGHMKVLLHRRRGGVEGIYRCLIPDSMNVTQTIYIGVYSARSGEWCMYTLLFN